MSRHWHVILVCGQSNASAGLSNPVTLGEDAIDDTIKYAWQNLDSRFNPEPDEARIEAHTSNGWRTLQNIRPLPGSRDGRKNGDTRTSHGIRIMSIALDTVLRWYWGGGGLARSIRT